MNNINIPQSFWEFSLQVYRVEGVADAFLELQNKHGGDVNMLLFCCWYGVTRGKFQEVVFENAYNFSRGWGQQTVKPLRSIRIWLKQEGCHGQHINIEGCMEFREKVKGVELQAEKLQQLTLENLCRKVPAFESSAAGRLEAVVKNLKRYLQSAGIDIRGIESRHLETFIKACIDGAEAKQIREMVSSKE